MKVIRPCIVAAFTFSLICVAHRQCLATSPNRFYSRLNAYSVAIPQGWSQVPEELVRQQFGPGMADNNLTFDIDSVFALEFGEDNLAYPYAIVQIKRYSKYVVDRPLNKDEIKKAFNTVTNQMRSQAKEMENVENMAEQLPEKIHQIISKIELGKLYVDNKNMSVLLAFDIEASTIGKIRSLMFVSCGRFAWGKITFYCAESNWDRFRNDCDLILNSFQFDTTADYKNAPQKLPSFLENLSVDIAVYGIIGGIIFVIGILGSIVSKRRTKGGKKVPSSVDDQELPTIDDKQNEPMINK